MQTIFYLITILVAWE